MKLTPFVDRVRTLFMVLGIALVASVGAGHAYAADKKVDPLDAKLLTQGMAEVPAVLASAKITCEPTSAVWVGQIDGLAADNKTKVKGTRYEVACKAGPGFIITKMSDTETKDIYTCNKLTKLLAKDPATPVCILPDNKPDYKWLQPVVQPYLPGCAIISALYVGSSDTEPLVDRYEVQCKDMAGGMLDYAQVGATAPTDFKSCIIQEDSSTKCTLSTHEQMVASITPIATAADATCQVKDARYVGVNTEQSGIFYEFGCSNKPGFIVLAKASDSSVDRVINCGSAAGLGGCTLTDAVASSNDAKSEYTAILKAADYTCNVVDFDIKGTQESTKRDFVEFKCADYKWGKIGFVPQPGSTKSAYVHDCFNNHARKEPECTLTTPAELMAQWDKLIKVAKPQMDCDVKEVRYIAEYEDESVGAELACTNKRGYIAIIAANRETIDTATACRIAKSHGNEDQCTIAGNGTYNADDN